MHAATPSPARASAWRTVPLLLALVADGASAHAPPIAGQPALDTPPSGVVGMREAYLSPDFWVARLGAPDQHLLTRAQIDERNRRLVREDASMHDLSALAGHLTRGQVASWIERLAGAPTRPLWDEAGAPVPVSMLDAILANRALPTIPDNQPTRYGMALRRADLRTFPTALRVFNRRGETDIDRFQESALFPGDPVVIAHASADGRWLFVVSQRYAAWTPADAIAEGTRTQVLGYHQRAPYRVITGAKPRTVFTREQPQLSELQLEMGLRVPLADVAPDLAVNGQHPYSSWILDLPLRGADGRLAFAPALLPRIADSQPDYLPLTRANLIRQSFKFLGERYGWGHAYNGRDCSGFVSEVYRSMGIELPRNTSAQAVSPVFDRTAFKPGDSRASRMQAVAALDIGDLIYIPGHVMMYLGQVDGQPWVIHDTNGGTVRNADGRTRSLALNGVSITPLLPMRFGEDDDYVDRITSIVRVTRVQ